MIRTLAALLLLAPSLALGADPKAVIEGNARVPAGQVAVLDASKSVSEKPIKWKVVGNPAAILIPLDRDGRKGVYALLLNLPPGTHRVLAIAATATDADADAIEITVGEPAPAPKPDPTPKPEPPPPPNPPDDKAAGKVFVTLVWDSETDNARSTPLRTDPATRAAVEAQGGVWNTIEATSEAGKKYTANWKPIWQPPYVVIQKPEGKVLRELPGTATPAHVADAIKGVRP